MGDFGLSKNMGSEIKANSLFGHLLYTPLSEISKLGGYTKKLDIHYLGCLLFDLAKGKPTSHANRKIEKLHGYSQELKELIKKLINEIPEDRPSTDDILNMELMKPYYIKNAKTILNFDKGQKTLKDSDFQYAKGKACLILKNFHNALDCFKSAIKIKQSEKKPSDPELHSLLGTSFFNINFYREAIECFNEVIKIANKNQRDEQRLKELAKYMIKASQLNDSKNENANYFSSSKFSYVENHAETQGATTSKNTMKNKNSIATLTNAIQNVSLVSKKDNENSNQNFVLSPFYYETGERFYVLREYYDAAKCFFDSIMINQYDPKARFMYGKCLYKLSKQTKDEKSSKCLESALECFQVAIGLKKDDPYFYFGKGKALYCSDKLDEALLCLEEALKLENNNASFLCMKGKVLLVMADNLKRKNGLSKVETRKMFNDSESCFDEAIKINQNNSKYHFMKGTILYETENYKEAISSLITAILNEQNDSSFYYFMMGKSFYFMKEFSIALESLNKAISLNENVSEFYFYKGMVLLEDSSNIEYAIECFNDAISLDDKNDVFYFWRGNAFRKCRKFLEAIEDFNYAFKISDKMIYVNYYEETLAEMK